MASLPIDDTFHHQSQVLSEGGSQDEEGFEKEYENCIKNPRHTHFINVTDFQKEHLPPSYRNNPDFMTFIQNAIDRTVNIKISVTSENRPDTYPNSQVPYPFVLFKGSTRAQRCGTGYLEEFHEYKENQKALCLCKYCKTAERVSTKCWEFIVSTSTHLLCNKEEAESAIFELFYDSEGRERVQYIYGINLLGDENERYLTDYCRVTCVTHDAELGNKLKYFCDNTAKIKQPRDLGNWNSPAGILISHPHGTCKKISIGNIYHRCLLRHPKAMSLKLRKGRCCRFPSCNKQEERQHCESHVKNNSKSEFSKTHEGEENNGTSLLNLFENRNILEKSLVGDDIAQLTIDVKVILPQKAKYHMQRRIKDDSMHWYVFPPDTIFISPEGASLPFPSNMEFYMPNVQAAYNDEYKSNSYYVTYDMASCPGSSGARVIDLFRHNQHQSFHHFGSLPQYNVSGLIQGYYFSPHVSDSNT